MSWGCELHLAACLHTLHCPLETVLGDDVHPKPTSMQHCDEKANEHSQVNLTLGLLQVLYTGEKKALQKEYVI